MDNPGISVIVVSWNTRDITDKCLSCMKETVEFVRDRAKVEVLVVENDSADGTPEMIRKKHSWVKLFPSGSDLGYAKGNNYGFERTNPKNEYLLLLNNDAYVKEDTLAKCLDFFEENSQCDVLGCQLTYEDGRFQPSAGLLPSPSTIWSWMFGLEKLPIIGKFFPGVHPNKKEFYKERQVGWVKGAFIFMKREIFEKTKGFDENFFMYMEEVEWCRRVHDKNFQIWYTPNFSITHVDKASAFGLPEELAKIYVWEMMGLVYYLRKYYKRADSSFNQYYKIWYPHPFSSVFGVRE